MVPGLRDEAWVPGNPARPELQFADVAFSHSRHVDFRPVRPIIAATIRNQVKYVVGDSTRPMISLAKPAFRAQAVVGQPGPIHNEVGSPFLLLQRDIFE